MKGRFLLTTFSKSVVERNIYADKSALVLEWVLLKGVDKAEFSLREVALDTGIGLGTVHRVFESLVLKGYLQTIGIRTSKKFRVINATALLQEWIESYSLVKKCRMYSYGTAFQTREQIVEALKKAGLDQQVVLALHSSAEAHGCKNTNLQQLELYMVEPSKRQKLEKALKLIPKERGYDVLLVEPYYKALISREGSSLEKNLKSASPLLTFLDLYHFPLRGIEQAEYMARKIPQLKRIYKKGRKDA